MVLGLVTIIDAINKMNLTNWKEGGYKDWCRQRELREQSQMDRQSAIDYLKETHGNDLSRALPELVNYQLLQVMTHTETSDIADAIKDPTSFSRVLNSLVRLRKAGKGL